MLSLNSATPPATLRPVTRPAGSNCLLVTQLCLAVACLTGDRSSPRAAAGKADANVFFGMMIGENDLLRRPARPCIAHAFGRHTKTTRATDRTGQGTPTFRR